MTAAHTPAPWRVTQLQHVVGLGVWSGTPGGSNEYRICALGLTNGASLEANACLIAAAPDLLEALIGVLRVADRKTDEFDAARAAIAKAVQS